MAGYLLEVAILFCIQGWPSGTGQEQEMPNIQMYRRSSCQTRKVLMSIHKEHPQEISHIFKPSCVILW